MFHLLLALFCLSLLPWRSDAAFCSEAPDGKTGQFCSWHKTKGFIGGLDSTIQLKAALEATAWEKEVRIRAVMPTRIVVSGVALKPTSQS